MKSLLFAPLVLFVLAAWNSPVCAQSAEPVVAHRPFDFLGFKATILLAGADTGGTSAAMRIEIPAHAGPPPHIHTREDEVYIINSGTFQFLMDGTCIQAGPGDSVYMPKGHFHAFKNIGKHTGEQLLVVYPAGLEQFFLDVHQLGLMMPKDFGKLNELSNSKYGINHVSDHDFKAGKCKKADPHHE
jgi:mannose-6-phosphate isomerase-like protein (cupin superfamily)